MSDTMPRTLKMPPTESDPGGSDLTLRDRVLVVIGANGSGKTRYGAWLDRQNIEKHHRIAAHRALTFPDRVQPTDFLEAEKKLLYGDNTEPGLAWARQHGRWKNNPPTLLLNDYAPLLTVMVSESFEMSDRYRTSMRSSAIRIEPPITRLDHVKKIWEDVLLERELVVEGSRVETKRRAEEDKYHPKEMSDGERGVFYLIGEALSVPKDGVFIVDEPELHLHRAIQARLWDAIEQARPDCAFVYITHDLGFAASRRDATKIWLKDYKNEKWEWELVPDNDTLPESLLLEVVGSRQPILFVEGDRSSLDHFIYSRVFTDHTIIPCGSCESVIHSTSSFAARYALHHHKCQGIIDNDGRNSDDIEYLEGIGIWTTPVSEVENLFLTESVMQLVCRKLSHNPHDRIPKVKARVFEEVTRNRVQVVSNLVRQEIEARIAKLGGSADGVDELDASYGSAMATIKPRELYEKWDREIERVLTDNDYAGALRYYKNKGLASSAGNPLIVRYADQVLRWMKGEGADEFVAALRAAIPWTSRLTTTTA